jgi:hypothetical protein
MSEHTKQQIVEYLDDVNSSAPDQSPDYLMALIVEAFALTQDEAVVMWREWQNTP